jgi:hypothetical protein
MFELAAVIPNTADDATSQPHDGVTVDGGLSSKPRDQSPPCSSRARRAPAVRARSAGAQEGNSSSGARLFPEKQDEELKKPHPF